MKLKKGIIVVWLLLILAISGNVDVQADVGKTGMKILPLKENIKLTSSQSAIDTDKYTTIEEAADKVREKVANHRSSVRVFFKTKIDSPTKAYEKFKKELTKVTDNSSEGDYLYWDIKAEIPKYVYIPIADKGKVYYYYEFQIKYYYYTTLSQKKQVDSKVKSIIRNFGFTDGTTNYKKIKTIYDYVCKNVQYAYDLNSDMVFTSYSALLQGKAVCQGYAQLMYKMLKEAKVPVRLIPGYAGGELHGWNIVKIGKYYYNIDATWDSENYQRGYSYKNFLIGDGFTNHVRFDNYSNDAFYNEYPMAKYSYGTGKKALSIKSRIAKFRMKQPNFSKINGNKVVIKKVDTGVKYIIQYSTRSDFKGAKKTIARKRFVKLGRLQSNKKYYVRFRAVKTIVGKTVYTKWSEKKVIKVEE